MRHLRKVLASVTDTVVVPLLVGLLGGVVGGMFTRLTSRNDARRDKYAKALSTLRALESLPLSDASRPQALAQVDDIAYWLELDSTAVGHAFKQLVAATTSPAKSGEEQARDRYIRTARAYSRWTLLRRWRLQFNAWRRGW
jgi:hypothetical protein